MTTTTDIVNRALQSFGSRTTITSSNLTNSDCNEAIQANLVLERIRDEVLRRAPWGSARNFALLAYITSAPGTPENPNDTRTSWAKGLPPPPWAYEYQYPVDCLKALFVVPQFTTGFASGIPITTAITGSAPSFWMGPPQRFEVSIDQFYPVTAATKVAGGSGYAVGDIITLTGTPSGSNPIGAPCQLRVATLSGSAVATVTVVNVIAGSSSNQGGSYFAVQSGTISQDTTTGSGTGATFTLTQGSQGDQRVILSQQESAMLCYIRQITDPNVMDPDLQEAWVQALGGRLCIALTGDKTLANICVAQANSKIMEARVTSANEALTVNDVTPDWVRARGIYYPSWEISPNVQYDWGPLLSVY